MSRIAPFGSVRQREPRVRDKNERWLPVIGYEAKYEVSDQGRIRSIDHWGIDTLGRRRHFPGRILTPSKIGVGYFAVVLEKRSIRIHSMVMAAFVGPRSPDMFVLHNNGQKLDNRLVNLRYGTPKENNADAVKHGAIKFGSARASAKLTDERVAIIRGLSGSISDAEIARVFDVAAPTVRGVRLGNYWTRSNVRMSLDEAAARFIGIKRGLLIRDTLPVLVGALNLCERVAAERRA